MPKLNATYSGTGLAVNALAIKRMVEANGIKSILEIGCNAEKDRRLFLPETDTPGCLYYGHRTLAGSFATLPGLVAPYDLVYAPRWLSTFSLEDLPKAIKELRRLVGKVLLVYEDETANAVTAPQRPRGWDRVDWCKLIGGSLNKTHVFAMTCDAAGISQNLGYMTQGGNGNIWHEITY